MFPVFKSALLCLTTLLMTSCGYNKANAQSNNQQNGNAYNMNITINNRTLTANLIDNSSTQALKSLLEQGDLTFTVNDYGGFEKVGSIGHNLPQNNESITTVAGDIILYMGNSICFYYAPNAWNFTRLGRINYTSEAELKEFLNAGGGSTTVTLSLTTPTTINNAHNAPSTPLTDNVYDLNGKRVNKHSTAQKGIFIVNGKKIKR